MRKLFYLAFCLVLVAGFGCAITDYGIITDNDQTNDNDADLGGGSDTSGPGITNTNGKAHIQETSQIATIWPDGTDETINFIDQKADGTATLTTYNNFSSGAHPTFHDDLYCNPDWQGCSIFTASDDNDGNLFDGTFNGNCSGARSLSILLSTGRYYGECGRVSKVSLESRLNLLGMGTIATRYGKQGLLYNWNSSNFSITLENELGQAYNAPILGSGQFWFSGEDNTATLDVTNSLFGSTISWFASFQDQHASDITKITACYSGICADTLIAGDHPVASGSRIRAGKNARF